PGTRPGTAPEGVDKAPGIVLLTNSAAPPTSCSGPGAIPPGPRAPKSAGSPSGRLVRGPGGPRPGHRQDLAAALRVGDRLPQADQLAELGQRPRCRRSEEGGDR